MSVNPPQQLCEGSGLGSFTVQDEINGTIERRLRNILPALAAIYVVLAALALLARPSVDGRIDGEIAYLAGIGSLGAWMLLRRNRIARPQMHPLAAGLSGVILLHGLVSLQSSNVAGPAAVVFLIIAASGATLYSLRWHSVVTIVSFAGWFVVALPILPVSVLSYWSLVLLATAALSGINLQYRRWKLRTIDNASAGNVETFDRRHLARAVEGTQDGLWYWELESDVFHFSTAWATLLGFEAGELAKHPNEWLNRVHPGYLARLRTELAAHLHGNAPQFRNEHRIRRKDGTYIWVLARGTVVRSPAGEPVVLAGSHSDITPLMEAEKRLLADAFNDELTGLPNRNFLMTHLEMVVEEKRSRGNAAPLFAVMFLDLDRFKSINDTMGHDVGDQLLAAVAARLKNCARPDDVVARFGGDEFVILLRNLWDPEEAMRVGSRILKALATPFQLGERTIQSGCSIGIAHSREAFTACDEILRFGDIAMYRAKALRNGMVQLFHPGMLEKSNEQGALRRELEGALRRGQLVLHYQPFIHTATGRIVGAEALIRWQRSPGELLYPAEFLPLAEKTGLIHEIGEWALRTACAQNSSWQRAGISPVRIAVNLSASQLQQSDFPQRVQRVLVETNLKPEWLELELSEASLVRGSDVAAATLKALSDSGIRASINDFGSGNASLSYLRQFQFHTMKLDRSFITDIATDSKAAAVARGLISLAHSLDLSVIAEGVENDDQFKFLSAEHCDQVQGYLTGRPVPGDEMLALLRAGQGLAAPFPEVTARHGASNGPEEKTRNGILSTLRI